MEKSALSDWALANGWQLIAGYPSLTKPSAPKEAIVRLVLKATVANVEAKKPAGKWEKVAGAPYAQIEPDPDGGMPRGLGLEAVPSIGMLMQENRDRLVFVRMTGPTKS